MAADVLVLKVREGGRVVNVHALAATAVNGDGHREILGLHVKQCRGRRRLVGVPAWPGRPRPIWSPAVMRTTASCRQAIGATLPGASWQRCHIHYAANLMSVTPKASWPWVKTLLHSVYDQPDAQSVHDQFGRVLDALADKLPTVVDHLEAARADVLAFTAFPKELCARSGRTTPRKG